MKYRRIAEVFYNTPWAMDPDKFQAVEEFIRSKAFDARPPTHTPAVGRMRISRYGNIGVIPVYGVITHRANMIDDISSPGATSTELLGKQIQSAIDDDAIKTIVLDIDSPGGTVAGVIEVANLIYESRRKKKIVAQANALAASAAYWIGCAAQHFYVTPSGMVGSVGVVAAHQDISRHQEKQGVKTTLISAGRHKVEGNMYEPLNEEAYAALQSNVDYCYNEFVTAIARYRRVDKNTVINRYGQGRAVLANTALNMGMVDGISTMDRTLRLYNPVRERRGRMSLHAEIDLLELEANIPNETISSRIH